VERKEKRFSEEGVQHIVHENKTVSHGG